MSNDGGQKNMRFLKPSPEWDSWITTSGYGFREDPATGKIVWHGGIDKSRWDIRGKPIYLGHDATVRIRSDYYGEVHADAKEGGEVIAQVYGHMMNIPANVKKGAFLKVGTLIGYVDNKGYSTGDHIHFGLVDMLTGKTLNPDLHWKSDTPQPQPQPQDGVYVVKRGGWRSQVIVEMIQAGIYKGTWQENIEEFNKLNPITPTGGWRAGDKVFYKKGSTPEPDKKEYFTVKKGGWRSQVIQEIIDAGIWSGTWQDNRVKFDELNPKTPTGGWRAGQKVRIK